MTGEANRMVPQIRLSGFIAEWSTRSIQELVNEGAIYPPQDGNHGELHPKAADYVVRDIPFIMANNIRGGEIDLRDCSHICRKQADSLRIGFALAGDVLLTHKGTVGETAIVPNNEFPFIMLTPQVTYYRIADRAKLNREFLAFSFASPQFQHALKEVSGGGTRAYVGITQQKRLKLTFPPHEAEQTQIGAYFRELDRLIGLQQRKHDKLVALKKAMLQKMFPQPGATTPEIRFKGFSGAWEERKLGERASFIKGQGYSKGDLTTVGTPIVLYGRLYVNYQTVISQVDTFVKEKKGSIKSIGNEVIVPASGETAEDIARASAIITSGIILGGDLNIIFPFHELNSCFLALTLSNGRPQLELARRAQGKTVVHVRKADLESILIPYPRLDEQKKIGTYFRTLDELISRHAIQLQKLKQIKSACLEKMFV